MPPLFPYIEKIVRLTEHTDTVFCENKCLKALFQYYFGYANEKHIPINISAVCKEVSVKDTDILESPRKQHNNFK